MIPNMGQQDMRNAAQGQVFEQAMQDPMQQIMQMMQMQQGQQQMQQAAEESPLQMALRQLQIEAQQQQMMQGQQQFQQNEQIFPLEMAQKQAMIDYYRQNGIDQMPMMPGQGQEQQQVPASHNIPIN